jgi:nucleotide-binding universal stress UspA family protein
MTSRPPQVEHRQTPKPLSASIFERILVGIDGTEAGFEACRQTARLAGQQAEVEAVAVVHLGPAVAAALDAAHVADVLEREAEEALDHAIAILDGRAHKRYLDGFVASALRDELESFGASLVALGTHGHRRSAEILLGGVAGEILHTAPCSVLIARPCPMATFPRTVVVGHDGSPRADEALAVARQLEARFGSTTACSSRSQESTSTPTASSSATRRRRRFAGIPCGRSSRLPGTPTCSSWEAAGCTASRRWAACPSGSPTRRPAPSSSFAAAASAPRPALPAAARPRRRARSSGRPHRARSGCRG